ncbi:MAG TPA: alpha/beta fold hydrolase [Acidimicrobiales bacterium]|nr:alpha/beta fold hydrolase [Acidimicrobiales bacterium]
MVTCPGAGAAGLARHDGVAIAYQVIGPSGPWLVLVHGLGYGRRGWGPFATMLANSRRVVLVDNRGIGDSDCPPGPYSVDQMAGDVVAVLDDIGIGSCDILGASLGGMVTLQVTAAHPERIRRMVLIAATPGEPQGAPMPDNTTALLRGHVRVNNESTARKLIEGALAAQTVATRPELVDCLVDLHNEQDQAPEAWRSQAAASAGFTLRRTLRTMATPTLAIAGTDDAVIDPANTIALAFALPDARAFFVAPAGHLCFWEEPELLAEAVHEHLDASRPAEAGESGA